MAATDTAVTQALVASIHDPALDTEYVQVLQSLVMVVYEPPAPAGGGGPGGGLQGGGLQVGRGPATGLQAI